MIFDVLILLGLGILSALGVHMAYKSHRHYMRVQAFSALHLNLAEMSNKRMYDINKDLKQTRSTLNAEIKTVTPICPYGRQNCGVCGDGGKCVFDRMSTRSQKEDK